MGKSTVNPPYVTFSAGTRTRLGDEGTPSEALRYVGLLGDTMPFNVEQNFRAKTDRYPEVTVAESIQSQAASVDATLREWTRPNMLLALGLEPEDTDIIIGGDQTITEARSLTNGMGLLSHPVKGGSPLTVTSPDGNTTYQEGVDYFVLARDLEGRSLVVRRSDGNIPEGAGVSVQYTYVGRQQTVMPIGRRATVKYYAVEFEEEYTNGTMVKLRFHRARIGLRGSLNMQGAEDSADLPIAVQALFDPTQNELASLTYTDLA